MLAFDLESAISAARTAAKPGSTRSLALSAISSVGEGNPKRARYLEARCRAPPMPPAESSRPIKISPIRDEISITFSSVMIVQSPPRGLFRRIQRKRDRKCRDLRNTSRNFEAFAQRTGFPFVAAPTIVPLHRLECRMVVKKFVKTFAIVGVFFLQQIAAPPSAHAEPDLSGVWLPDIKDQKRQETANMPPWKPDILQQVQHLVAEEKAGRPFLVLSHCLPHGMPSWMLMTHNAFELLVTPGRITMLGEVDGNRMRRIYMDGRKPPEDPDPSLHGYSIGHWDGDTLVIDTTSIVPQAYIAISEAVGIPNNGDMHVVEHIHLTEPNVMHDDLEITAPNVLTTTWKTTRIFRRYPDRHYEVAEGECAQEDLVPGKDADGNDIFVPNAQGAFGTVHTK